MKMKLILALVGVCVLFMGGAVVSYEHGNAIIGDNNMFMVSHSEYWSGEQGMIVGRLLDYQGEPITVSNCTVDIYYPDMTLFISEGVTNDSLQASTGTHFYKFTTPSIEGVYEYIMTCNYPPNKDMSVANSFHLSPALNLVGGINDSIADLTAQELLHYNDLQANISVINSDLLIIKTDLDDIELNITDIYGDTQYIRDNMLSEAVFTSNITSVLNNQDTIILQGGQVLSNLTAIENFCGDDTTSGSQLCLLVNEIQSKVTDINNTVRSYEAYMQDINSTAHSTYDYVTGTLATNINNIISSLSAVETNTEQINSTVNEIKQNQEDRVYMEVTG
jgi:hypothetical protein